MAKQHYISQARGASSINVLLGCWLIASPWIFSYTLSASAFWNSIAAGALVALLAFSRVSTPRGGTGQSWLSFLLGLWTIASPWIYGYWVNGSALWDNVAVGIAIAAMAAWSASTTEQYRNTNTPHTPTPTAVR